jgi:hypothetical protein
VIEENAVASNCTVGVIHKIGLPSSIGDDLYNSKVVNEGMILLLDFR